MSWTWWNATANILSKSIHWEACYGISNIFQHCGRPPFWIKKKIIFDRLTVVVVLICCRVPNFIKIGSRVRPPDAHNCKMLNVPLLGNGGNGHCHGNRIMADMSETWWEATTQASSQSVHWLASYGISNFFQHGGRPPFWILKCLILD